MKKTPSTLKWLAEKRARVAGDLAHMEGILAEVQTRLARLSGELATLDGTLAIYDSSIEAPAIESIHPWQNRYGKRGDFKVALAAVLRERAPDALSTEALALAMMVQFDLCFELEKTRLNWRKNSLLSELRRLMRAGLIKCLHNP